MMLGSPGHILPAPALGGRVLGNRVGFRLTSCIWKRQFNPHPPIVLGLYSSRYAECSLGLDCLGVLEQRPSRDVLTGQALPVLPLSLGLFNCQTALGQSACHFQGSMNVCGISQCRPCLNPPVPVSVYDNGFCRMFILTVCSCQALFQLQERQQRIKKTKLLAFMELAVGWTDKQNKQIHYI